MKSSSVVYCILAVPYLILGGCSQKQSTKNAAQVVEANYGGFKSQVDWGKHLVTTGGCNDCHTPKMMTAMGPVNDTTLTLSGHPANGHIPDVNRDEMESKGLSVSNDFTAWVGPWGITYAANLTPDETGIGNWTQAQFFKAIRERKFMGMDGTRPLLPPMSIMAVNYATMSDNELAAVFAYLKSLKPVHNEVPAPEPPVMAVKH